MLGASAFFHKFMVQCLKDCFTLHLLSIYFKIFNNLVSTMMVKHYEPSEICETHLMKTSYISTSCTVKFCLIKLFTLFSYFISDKSLSYFHLLLVDFLSLFAMKIWFILIFSIFPSKFVRRVLKYIVKIS